LREYWPDHFHVCNDFLQDFPPQRSIALAEMPDLACFMGGG
jgi:hypothetical protein